MRLLKVCANVNKEGRLILPMESMNLEGFRPGDEVPALLAVPEDGEFPGLMMLAAPKDSALSFFTQDRGDEDEEDAEETDDFTLPHDLLRAAGIPIDGDLDITCVPGAIIIRESDVLDRLPDGLREIFRSFGIQPDTVREVMKKEGYFA
jgi:bifunctional DNA-binding transcriptional regulator/antitoxin component of YhaV-PrlF toxin-antitoxin module